MIASVDLERIGSHSRPIFRLLEAGLPGGAERETALSRQFSSGEGRNRTGDTTIFSRVLYQLSYLAAAARS
jgi:hypothetical protein